MFHQLTQDEIVQMVDLMVKRVQKALFAKDMDIEVSDKAKRLLAQRGFDPVLGARPLRRTIQREVEDQLSEKLLFGELGAGELVEVDVEGWDEDAAPKKTEDAKFTFTGKPRPESSIEAQRKDAEDKTPEDMKVPGPGDSRLPAAPSGPAPDGPNAGGAQLA